MVTTSPHRSGQIIPEVLKLLEEPCDLDILNNNNFDEYCDSN